MKATEADFERLYGVAKAHGLTFQGVESIARTELGKPLGDFTKEELEAFAFRLCPTGEKHSPAPAMDLLNDYSVSFQIRRSHLTFEQFVEWVNRGAGPKAENLYIQHFYTPWSQGNSRGEFWQQSRRCDCGSHFFENGSVMSKVKCSRCGKEFDVQ